jgi:hypothetical protein
LLYKTIWFQKPLDVIDYYLDLMHDIKQEL